MKIYFFCLLIVTHLALSGKSDGERHSQTFMMTRPINQNIVANQCGWHTALCQMINSCGSSFHCYGTYQSSVHQDRIDRYFLPFRCKNSLIVAGDNATDQSSRDIRAEWLGITDPQFQGTMTLQPRQKQAGVFAEYARSMAALTSWDFFQDSWISICMPFVMVENNIGICKNSPISQALARKELKFSRIVDHARSRIELAEINIKLGRAYLSDNFFEILYYSGLRIPTSRGQNARFLFSPFAGNNRHLGFQTGVQFQIKLSDDCSPIAYTFFTALESSFFIRNKQLRTYDLKKKPWSRYLLLNKKDGPADFFIPATQILTLRSRVKPYNMVEFSTGWRMHTQHVEGEIGYGLWAHGDERVKPECHFDESYGIAGTGATAQGFARSASKSTISNQAANDTIIETSCINNEISCSVTDHFVTIGKSDLNRRSAAARAAINHRIHASCSYFSHGNRTTGFITLGGLYEYPQKNSALELWAIWLKGGITF